MYARALKGTCTGLTAQHSIGTMMMLLQVLVMAMVVVNLPAGVRAMAPAATMACDPVIWLSSLDWNTLMSSALGHMSMYRKLCSVQDAAATLPGSPLHQRKAQPPLIPCRCSKGWSPQTLTAKPTPTIPKLKATRAQDDYSCVVHIAITGKV